MWVILLEALLALLLFIGLVWWTMFSGRRGGERRVEDEAPPAVLPSPPEHRPGAPVAGDEPPASHR